MTLLRLARAWIQARADTGIFHIDKKEIIITGAKGEVVIRMQLRAMACLYIGAGTVVPVEYRLTFHQNAVQSCHITADTLTEMEKRDL